MRAVKTVRRTVEAGLRIRENNRKEPNVKPPPSPFSAPPTSFNAALTPHRAFATASLSLPDVKDLKNALGATVNDVVLTLCAGALRNYLDSRDEHPNGPLVAMVPISVRSDDQKGTHGNQVSMMLTSLATDLDDPLDRLAAIHEGMAVGEGAAERHRGRHPAELGRVRGPGRARPGRAHLLAHQDGRPSSPLFNVTISNVPGPPFPLYVAGAQMKATYPIGPIFDGGGLNITVMSYMDSLDFGFLVCPELIPDPWQLADAMHEALEQMKKAVAASTGGDTADLRSAGNRRHATPDGPDAAVDTGFAPSRSRSADCGQPGSPSSSRMY